MANQFEAWDPENALSWCGKGELPKLHRVEVDDLETPPWYRTFDEIVEQYERGEKSA